MKKLLSKIFGKKQRHPRPESRTRGFRPRVEALEERALMTVGLEFHVNTKVDSFQNEAAVASQPALNGRSVVVWRDSVSNSSDSNIRAQRYNGAGAKIGGEILVASSPRRENQPSVAMDAAGNFVVSWTDPVSPTNADIRAQRFLANGGRRGGVIAVSSDARREYDSSVGMDASGNFMVSYSRQLSSSDTDIILSRYASNGAPLGSFPVADSQAMEINASLACSPDGRFSIAYEIVGPTNVDIWLERFNALGQPIGTHFLATDSQREINPDVAMDRFGNTVVVWETELSSFDHDIKARKVFSNGAVGPTLNVDSSVHFEHNPTVAMDMNDGDFVVAYNRSRNTGHAVVGPDNLIVREMAGTGARKAEFNLGDVGGSAALAINESDVYFLAYNSVTRPNDPWGGVWGRRGLLV